MDLEVAQYLTTMQKPHIEIICYHCQQCAEKMLKGFLVYNDIEPDKTHNLPTLCKQCEKISIDFDSISLFCLKLNGYITTTRYPNKIELSEYDMQEAIKFATEISKFVNGLIK